MINLSPFKVIVFTFFCVFPHDSYGMQSASSLNILSFGAKADDRTVNTASIQRAVDSSYSLGGGTVVVPAGIFLTGTVELRSNVDLYLERGAVLKGSPSLSDYRPYQSPSFSSPSTYGIIFAKQAVNISISGLGTIDGNETVFFDWTKAKAIEWSGVQLTRQGKNYRAVNSGIGDGPVVPKDRPRQMVIFSQCRNVQVRGVQLNRSPFWTLHFADCDGVLADGLTIHASLETPNSDGIDITSSSNVIISNCDIRTGDDAIAITGYSRHFELPGYDDLKHTSENISITGCNLQSRSSGIRIGWLDQNSVRNIVIANINITNSNRGIGIFVRDEGSIENVSISQVNIETRLHTGDWWGNGEPIHLSAVRGTADGKLGRIRNISFRDINAVGESGILLYGSKESIIDDVRFDNVRCLIKDSPLNDVAGGNIDLRGCFGDRQLFASDIPAFYAQFVSRLTVMNSRFTWDDNIRQKYFTHGIQINNFTDVSLINNTAESSPSNSAMLPVSISNGAGFTTTFDRQQMNIKNVTTNIKKK